MNEEQRAALAALSEGEREFLRSLTEEQRAALQLTQSRTVADMPAEEFAASLTSAVTEGLRSALSGAGVGVVDRSTLHGTEPRVIEQRPALDLRVQMAMRHHPMLRGLPDAERNSRMEGFHLAGEWLTAMTAGDQERADVIAISSYGGYLPDGMTPEQARAISTGAASAGALVPLPLQGPIIEKRELADKITPRSNQFRSEHGQAQVSVEGVQLTAVGVAENADTSTGATDATYDPINLVAKKSVVHATASREITFDALAAMQFVQNISSQAGRKLGGRNNQENLNGDGTGVRYTDGILVNASIATVLGGAATRALMQAFIYAMNPEFWDNLVWLMDVTSLQSLAAVSETDTGIVYPNLNVNQTQSISGDAAGIGAGGIENIPVLILPSGATGMNGIVVLANLDFFATLVEDAVRVETTIDGGAAFDNDQQKWKFVQRQDGAVSLADGFIKSATAIT